MLQGVLAPRGEWGRRAPRPQHHPHGHQTRQLHHCQRSCQGCKRLYECVACDILCVCLCVFLYHLWIIIKRDKIPYAPWSYNENAKFTLVIPIISMNAKT